MSNRRSFLQSIAALSTTPFICNTLDKSNENEGNTDDFPLVVSTWNNQKANEIAYNALNSKHSLLDALEKGVNHVESDENDQSVGYGGRPDRAGNVTLDACIMDDQGNAGSVCYLQNIAHPISVARKVMELTPHVILAGAGAQKFAIEQGFPTKDLLTARSKKEWEEWKKTAEYKPKANIERHDTIGMLAMNADGNISGACSTSGMAYKLEGRVGDSPIIGAGLFVDNEVGAAVATGVGELVLKSLGSFLVVELIRQGNHPQKACEMAVERIIKGQKLKDQQVGYLAVDKAGEIGAFSILPGFVYALKNKTQAAVIEVDSYYK